MSQSMGREGISGEIQKYIELEEDENTMHPLSWKRTLQCYRLTRGRGKRVDTKPKVPLENWVWPVAWSQWHWKEEVWKETQEGLWSTGLTGAGMGDPWWACQRKKKSEDTGAQHQDAQECRYKSLRTPERLKPVYSQQSNWNGLIPQDTQMGTVHPIRSRSSEQQCG